MKGFGGVTISQTIYQPKKYRITRTALFPVCILLFAAVVLLVERMGIGHTVNPNDSDFLPQTVIANKPDPDRLPKECLMLVDTEISYAADFYKQMEFVLKSISVGYDMVDVRKSSIPDFNAYKTVVMVIPDYSLLGTKLQSLFDWVQNGGKMLLLCPIEPTPAVRTVLYQLGVMEMSSTYTPIAGIKIQTDFMIGSKGFEFNWGNKDVSTVALHLSPAAVIHVVSNTGVPLLWEKDWGKGHVVVNHLSLGGKEIRGYYTAAYSLLYDAFAYPVINSEINFIDDFPAPLPSGENEYIQKFYHRDIQSFYTDVWWPDMMNLSKQYGLKYTGLLVETYNDKVQAPFDRNIETSRYSYFGNMLLKLGGEIGYHGYNHQPLCFQGFDFKGKVDYKTWNSENDVKLAFDELVYFGNSVFPNNSFAVYVPPSNILTEEGEKVIRENIPQIRTISGVYILEDYEYEQEFSIADDGIINLPRIVAGTEITGYDRWLAFNELNFHYVSSHFFHPDDALDAERGASKGWDAMFSQFEEYVRWLQDVAPNLRKCTASDAAKAVERYDTMNITRTFENSKLTLDIHNFYDSAYCIVRIRDGKPGSVKGGSLEEINTGLYILKATSPQVEIEIAR